MGRNSQKGSRDLRQSENLRKSRPIKRKPVNPKLIECDEESFSASAKKLKMQEDIIVPEDYSIEYRILNFISVFTTLSTFVKCKDCNGNVKFQTASSRGLGFKIVVLCDSCLPRNISSCPNIGNTYEINRRFIFTMRVLGLGLRGAQKFCGLMDMPQFYYQSTYDMITKHINASIKILCQQLFKKAAKEEIQQTCKETNVETTTELWVSGDGTWKKRGFTSLYGVSSIIGFYSGKVLDILVKSAYCKMCEFWGKRKGTFEYEEWLETHESNCSANHAGSSGKMEVDAIIEMFKRSEENYDVKYKNYIGDGDSKTYSGIVNSAPYSDTAVIKKECIGHVQKRMGSRLRECKKKNKGLGGKNKLTGKMIDKLTIYYGLAIRRNCNSIENMKNAIWATYEHYSSTDNHPQHSKCPTGADSWCTWQRASASGTLSSFTHDYKSLPDDVLTAIKPIYADLSKTELLERCLGGFTQNNNESLNQLIWKISPKIIPSGNNIVEIAAFIAAGIFNEGNAVLLKMLQAIGVSSGPNAHRYVEKEDAARIKISNLRKQQTTQEARSLRRQAHIEILEAAADLEGVLYGPGIDDSV